MMKIHYHDLLIVLVPYASTHVLNTLWVPIVYPLSHTICLGHIHIYVLCPMVVPRSIFIRSHHIRWIAIVLGYIERSYDDLGPYKSRVYNLNSTIMTDPYMVLESERA